MLWLRRRSGNGSQLHQLRHDLRAAKVEIAQLQRERDRLALALRSLMQERWRSGD